LLSFCRVRCFPTLRWLSYLSADYYTCRDRFATWAVLRALAGVEKALAASIRFVIEFALVGAAEWPPTAGFPPAKSSAVSALPSTN
jgi:hypothetical protein